MNTYTLTNTYTHSEINTMNICVPTNTTTHIHIKIHTDAGTIFLILISIINNTVNTQTNIHANAYIKANTYIKVSTTPMHTNTDHC